MAKIKTHQEPIKKELSFFQVLGIAILLLFVFIFIYVKIQNSLKNDTEYSAPVQPVIKANETQKSFNTIEEKVDNLTFSEKNDITYWCKEAVKNSLKSPSTADFASFSSRAFIAKSGKISAISYVDSQNSFWAQLRMYFECIVGWDWNNIFYESINFEN